MGAVVTAGAVVATLEDGTPAYFYRGQLLHDGVPSSEVARLEVLGLVETGDAFVPVFPPAVVPAVADFPTRPKRVASKEEWVTFALAQGGDPASVEASTKEELVAVYGG